MNNQFEYRGYWWRASEPDRQVAGILTYIPNERIELELIGDFYEDSMLARTNNTTTVIDGKEVTMCAPKDNSEPVINGLVYDKNKHAKNVTLFLCSYLKSNFNPSCGFPIIKYKPRYILIGGNFLDVNDCIFNRLRVYTPIMNNWLFPDAINSLISFDEKDKSKTTKMSWEIQPVNNLNSKYEFQIDKEFQVSFYSTAGCATENNNAKVHINQSTAFEFSKIEGKANLSELLHKMALFIDFLNLAALNTVFIDELVLYTNVSKENLKPISLYFVQAKEFEDKHYSSIDYLFTFNQVSGVFQNLIQKWYCDSDIIAPIRDHLVSSIIRKPSFVSGDFLIVVQALEGYHRRFINEKREKLLERLKNLVSNFEYIDRIKLNDDDLESIVQSRDYYSHFFKREEKPKLLEGKELFLKYVHLRVLLICCTLRLIGLQDDIIKELVTNCRNNILSTDYF